MYRKNIEYLPENYKIKIENTEKDVRTLIGGKQEEVVSLNNFKYLKNTNKIDESVQGITIKNENKKTIDFAQDNTQKENVPVLFSGQNLVKNIINIIADFETPKKEKTNISYREVNFSKENNIINFDKSSFTKKIKNIKFDRIEIKKNSDEIKIKFIDLRKTSLFLPIKFNDANSIKIIKNIIFSGKEIQKTNVLISYGDVSTSKKENVEIPIDAKNLIKQEIIEEIPASAAKKEDVNLENKMFSVSKKDSNIEVEYPSLNKEETDIIVTRNNKQKEEEFVEIENGVNEKNTNFIDLDGNIDNKDKVIKVIKKTGKNTFIEIKTFLTYDTKTLFEKIEGNSIEYLFIVPTNSKTLDIANETVIENNVKNKTLDITNETVIENEYEEKLKDFNSKEIKNVFDVQTGIFLYNLLPYSFSSLKKRYYTDIINFYNSVTTGGTDIPEQTLGLINNIYSQVNELRYLSVTELLTITTANILTIPLVKGITIKKFEKLGAFNIATDFQANLYNILTEKSLTKDTRENYKPSPNIIKGLMDLTKTYNYRKIDDSRRDLKELEDNKFLNERYKEIGNIHVFPTNGTANFRIPFQFNPKISEGSVTANYANTSFVGRIGEIQTYVNTTALNGVSIETKYYSLSDKNDGSVPFSIYTSNYLKFIEGLYRALVLPSFTEETYTNGTKKFEFTPPPVIRIVMGSNVNKEDYGNILVYPVEIGNSFYKNFIVTSLSIEKDQEEFPYILDDKGVIGSMGFSVQMNLVEISPEYKTILPDFNSYNIKNIFNSPSTNRTISVNEETELKNLALEQASEQALERSGFYSMGGRASEEHRLNTGVFASSSYTIGEEYQLQTGINPGFIDNSINTYDKSEDYYRAAVEGTTFNLIL